MAGAEEAPVSRAQLRDQLAEGWRAKAQGQGLDVESKSGTVLGGPVNLIDAAKADGQQLIDITNSDYQYRIIVGPERHCRVLETLERSIDYPDSMERIGQLCRWEKHCPAYHKICGILEGLQPRKAYGGVRGSD